jgi:hypothetical protein
MPKGERVLADEKVRKVIFEAINHHGPACGEPPQIITEGSGQYSGYYENQHGEQFIFVYDRQTKRATLWVGDNGWEHPVAITDPQKPEIVLGREEWLWLQSCWMAATGFEGK